MKKSGLDKCPICITCQSTLISKQKNETCQIIPVTGVTVNVSLLKGFPDGAGGDEPACQRRRHEMQDHSPGWEDPLVEEMANHPVFLPGESLWTEEPGRLWSTGSQSWTRLKQLNVHTSLFKRGGGDISCL